MPEEILMQIDEVERPATPAEIAWIELVRQSTPADE